MSEENVYKQARLKAAKTNTFLATQEGARQLLYISREKLMMIEQDEKGKRRCDPSIDDVMNMCELYNAPELSDYYCTHQCPLRKGEKPLMHDNLGEIASSLMSALHFLGNANDSIHRILSDSKISDVERSEFERVLNTLKDLVYSIDSLELWARKNDII